MRIGAAKRVVFVLQLVSDDAKLNGNVNCECDIILRLGLSVHVELLHARREAPAHGFKRTTQQVHSGCSKAIKFTQPLYDAHPDITDI